MNDAEYLFKQTEIERKKRGYGDKHKKRGGGRFVRLPSDNLTKKEREAMNGEVKSWKEKPFYSKEEFLKLPSDVQLKWANSIINRYGVGLGGIVDALQWPVQRMWLYSHFNANGDIKFVNKVKGGVKAAQGIVKLRQDFKEWRDNLIAEACTGQATSEPQEPEVEVHEMPVTTCEIKEQEAGKQLSKQFSGKDYLNIVALLKSLAGTGAKLTIEVTL